MYARVSRIELEPGTEDEALRAFKMQGTVAFEALDGFAGLTVYLDRDHHVGFLVTHWETHSHAVAAGNAQSLRDFGERIQRMVAAPAATEICEVAYVT